MVTGSDRHPTLKTVQKVQVELQLLNRLETPVTDVMRQKIPATLENKLKRVAQWMQVTRYEETDDTHGLEEILIGAYHYWELTDGTIQCITPHFITMSTKSSWVISRYATGICSIMYSENVPTFKHSNRELKEVWKATRDLTSRVTWSITVSPGSLSLWEGFYEHMV